MASSDPFPTTEARIYGTSCEPENPSPATTLPDTSSPASAIVAMPITPLAESKHRKPSPRRVKSKIRENPVLERFVSDMLLRGYSFRDIEKSVLERLHIRTSRETIRKYYEEVFLLRLAVSSPSKEETWRALLDLEDTMDKSVTKSEVEMFNYQAKTIFVLEERLSRLHEASIDKVSANLLNTIARTTDKVIKAQNELFDRHQEILGKERLQEQYRHRVLEALQEHLSRIHLVPSQAYPNIIRLVDFIMRNIEQ